MKAFNEARVTRWMNRGRARCMYGIALSIHVIGGGARNVRI